MTKVMVLSLLDCRQRASISAYWNRIALLCVPIWPTTED